MSPVAGDIPKRAHSNVKDWREVRNAIDVLNQRIDELASVGEVTISGSATTVSSLGAEIFILCDASTTPCIVTLPLASENKGRVYHVQKTDGSGNTVTIVASGTDLINGASSVVITTQDESLSLISNGIGWRIF